MAEILHREFVYLWYYFTLQLGQIFPYWVLGMVLGSAISVFAKGSIHALFGRLQTKRPPRCACTAPSRWRPPFPDWG